MHIYTYRFTSSCCYIQVFPESFPSNVTTSCLSSPSGAQSQGASPHAPSWPRHGRCCVTRFALALTWNPSWHLEILSMGRLCNNYSINKQNTCRYLNEVLEILLFTWHLPLSTPSTTSGITHDRMFWVKQFIQNFSPTTGLVHISASFSVTLFDGQWG